MAYKPKAYDQIADENDFDNEINRAKNAKAATDSAIARMDADIAAGKKVDYKVRAQLDADIADLNDFLSQESTQRPKVVTRANEAAAKKTKDEADKKLKEDEAKWKAEYDAEARRQAQAGSATEDPILKGLTPEQRQLIETGKTGKGYGKLRVAFNAANPLGLGWAFGDTDEEILADARGKQLFKLGGLDKTFDTEVNAGRQIAIPGGMSPSDYLKLLAIGDVDTLGAKMGIAPTTPEQGLNLGTSGNVQAAQDYSVVAGSKPAAESHRLRTASGQTPDLIGAGHKRYVTKNLISPALQVLLGGGAVIKSAYNSNKEAAAAASPDLSAFRPEDREFFRTKVEPIRMKLMEPKIKAAKDKSETSKKKLDASIFPVVGAGSEAYPSLSEKYIRGKWNDRYNMTGDMSANIKGVTGDEAMQSLAAEAATAYRAGDTKRIAEITADINSRLLSSGAKAKGPILIGGVSDKGPLSNLGIAALVPNEDGAGYRIVMTPRSGQGFGAPMDISTPPAAAIPDISSIGEEFTEEDYLKLGDEAQEALDRAIRERDSSLSPTPAGRRYRPRSR